MLDVFLDTLIVTLLAMVVFGGVFIWLACIIAKIAQIYTDIKCKERFLGYDKYGNEIQPTPTPRKLQ